MPQTLVTDCCIAGGGPAGMMCGYILARAGLKVSVLEKHEDFFRDFRGDTVHPSTMEVLSELGLLEDFLKRPHNAFLQLSALIGDTTVQVADFRHLPTKAKFMAVMPQWDFLNFMKEAGERYPNLDVRMRCEALDLIERDGRVVGVRAKGPEGDLDIEARLVIAADGRTSVLRAKAGLTGVDLGAPIDVLWMRLPRRLEDPNVPLGRMGSGHMMIMIERGDYFQCAYVTHKGGFDTIKAEGLEAFRQRIVAAAPLTRDRVQALTTWDDVKLLTVTVDRLTRWWRPGLLCIGDAAHAMSPVGGVGINLAIQDAVAAANLLAGPLKVGPVGDAPLAAVQARREGAVKLMQAIQVTIQNRVLAPLLAAKGPIKVPWPAKLLNAVPVLRQIPARVMGMGFRMEHVAPSLRADRGA
jgi:2-polyprenyl-6-methoxyphenol hydroxylase-like FAD-dependent oxidoreductase